MKVDADPTTWRRLIVGLGSAHGDDQAGWLMIDELERQLARHSPSVILRKLSSPVDALQELDGVDEFWVCDALDSCRKPGQVSRWTWPTSDLLRTRSSSSHQLGLSEVLELAAVLNRLPVRIEIWGIHGEQFRPGSEPSPIVRAACRRLAEEWSEEFARA